MFIYGIINLHLCICLCVGKRKIEHRVLTFCEVKVPQLNLIAT